MYLLTLVSKWYALPRSVILFLFDVLFDALLVLSGSVNVEHDLFCANTGSWFSSSFQLSVLIDIPGEETYHFQPRLFGKVCT